LTSRKATAAGWGFTSAVVEKEALMTAHTPARDMVPALQRSAATLFSPVQRELNRFFEELGEGWGAFVETHFAPRMDVVEHKDRLEVTVEVPGLTSDEVKVTAEDDVLTVSGEKSASSARSEGAARLTERTYGQFCRSIYLPRSVDPSKIAATMKDGVLKVSIPKRADAETRTIEIQSK
jgi:HSP20 family protein